jgi:hypothetical protein
MIKNNFDWIQRAKQIKLLNLMLITKKYIWIWKKIFKVARREDDLHK